MIGIILVAVAGAIIGTVRFVAESRYQSVPERLPQALAFGLLVGSPAVLAVLSRRRAILLAPAALLLTPLAFLSLAGVLLPLLVVAVLFWTALATRWDGLPCGSARGAAVVVAVPVLVIAGGVALFVHEDPRTYGDTNGCVFEYTATSATGSCAVPAGGGGSGGTSDVVTPVEASVSLGLLGAAFGIGWVLAGPRGLDQSSPAPVRGRRGG